MNISSQKISRFAFVSLSFYLTVLLPASAFGLQKERSPINFLHAANVGNDKSSNGTNAGDFFEPIVKDSKSNSDEKSCDELRDLDYLKRIAIRRLESYCQQQNLALEHAGFPSCRSGECFSQISFGNKESRQIELSLSTDPNRLAVFFSFTYKIGASKADQQIGCYKADLSGPYTLDQLDQLNAYMDLIELEQKCKTQEQEQK